MSQPLTPAEVISVSPRNFEEACFRTFRFQYENCGVYRQFCELLSKDPGSVLRLDQIPFLPVQFFKSHKITACENSDIVFESSGTTGSKTSRHFVNDISYYESSFLAGFKEFYGEPSEWVILALLPSYQERSNSSLVYMADKLIRHSGKKESGFVLNDPLLSTMLRDLHSEKVKTMLIGVTYALLDQAETFNGNLEGMVIMETGGMKGRREEITRPAVHEILKKAFNLSSIHSEYGMTELLSQAYSQSEGIFRTPGWMKILARETDDPQKVLLPGGESFTGATNIIDLANQLSCSFIATDDLCRLHPDGSFEILGRIDHCDIRGCSLMTA